MTITSPKPGSELTDSKAAAVRWTVVQSGLWVCNRSGEFAGMVEAVPGEGYVASSGRARRLGAFASLREAKARVARG